MKEFPFDLTFIQGKEYETPARVGLVIDKLGTDGTTATHLKIDGKELGDLIDVLAPLHKRETNKLGPLRLSPLSYVVPPETKLIVEGPSGAKMRAIGRYIILEPGETFPDDLLARFREQPDHYLTYVEGTYSHGTDVDLAVDAEVEVISLTPKTIETYLFNNVLMAAIANYTPAEGDLAIRFRLDGAELDKLLEVTKIAGIDILSAPRPPRYETNELPFTLETFPIEVLGDHTISIRARNIKGAVISPAAGTSLDFTITSVVEYKRTK